MLVKHYPDKIAAVRQERNTIIQYTEKKRQTTNFSPENTNGADGSPPKSAKQGQAELSNTMLEQVLNISAHPGEHVSYNVMMLF